MSDGCISPEALRDRLASAAAPTVVDVRGAEEYAAGHLPGVRHIPLSQLTARLAELPRDRTVVTYCFRRYPGESRSDWAATLLEDHGFVARVLDGGFPAWTAAGFAVERGQGGTSRSLLNGTDRAPVESSPGRERDFAPNGFSLN